MFVQLIGELLYDEALNVLVVLLAEIPVATISEHEGVGFI